MECQQDTVAEWNEFEDSLYLQEERLPAKDRQLDEESRKLVLDKIKELEKKYTNQYGTPILEMYYDMVMDLTKWLKS